jgi:hypothetical protein
MKVTLVLDPGDLDVIAAGLGELPLKIAKPVFDKVQQQLIEQQATDQKPPTDKS